MLKKTTLAVALSAMVFGAARADAADTDDLQQIRKEIGALHGAYEARIAELEARLREAEDKANAAQTAASEAKDAARQAPAATPSQAAGVGAFNPGVSLVLSGTYANLSKDPTGYRIANFIPGGGIGPGDRGFSLAESELGLSANIDHLFYGALNFAIHPDDTVSAEEAFIQTTALPYGLQFKAGRFFSGLGYLNEQHAHTWDFADAPLAYQAFLGGQFAQDGMQLKWLAPSATFFELGGEFGNGKNFPGADRNRNGAGSATLFAHVGGDVGVSNSWRAGLSWLRMNPRSRSYDDIDIAGTAVSNGFSGSSRLWAGDFVWKWAPGGNAERTNFKLQGEYFRRRESGVLTYDTAATASEGDYASAQSGWYLQGIYQFMPRWRVGLRHDRLDSGRVDYGANAASLANSSFDPKKTSLMFDWSPSEFSRVRLQFARDRSRDAIADRQIFLQYQMSLGAHGAHNF